MIIILIRTIIIYLIIVVSFRIMGKRQIGELEPVELVTAVLLSELACIPMQDTQIPLLIGIIPVLSLLSFELLMSYFSMKSIRFRSLLCGKPSVVIKDGKPLEKTMSENRFTLDELSEELRKNSITDLSTIQWGILETDGKLSLLPYPDHLPPTAKDMNVPVTGNGMFTIIISNGRVLKSNLKYRGLDDNWLKKQLQLHGVSGPSQVFILSVDENLKVYFLKKGGKGK